MLKIVSDVCGKLIEGSNGLPESFRKGLGNVILWVILMTAFLVR